MPYRETKPEATDLLSELPSVLTGQAIAFRQAIERHSFWTDSSGLSAGLPRLSDGSAGPGSARAFFDVASSASTALATVKPLAGRLYITSDTSRFLIYSGSNTTVPLGGNLAIVYGGDSLATIAAGTRFLAQSSNTSVVVNSRTTVPFPTTYNVAPRITVAPGSATTTDFFTAAVLGSTTTNVTLSAVRVYGSSNTCTIWWRSTGTVNL